MFSGWWMSNLYQQGLIDVLVSHIFWVIFSICLHELAHGWAAIWQGDNTPRTHQRMNMNPLVHMGPISLVTFVLTGFAWGLMPVDPSRFRWKRRGRIVVSGAGPAMNLLLAIASLFMLTAWMKFGPQQTEMYQHVSTFFFVGADMNIALALFNLLPIPPLDGSDVLAGLYRPWYFFLQRHNSMQIGSFILIVLIMTGMTRFIWVAGYDATWAGGEYLGSLFGNPPLDSVIQYGY